MADVAGIRIDEGLADILNRLRQAGKQEKKVEQEEQNSDNKEQTVKTDITTKLVDVPLSQNQDDETNDNEDVKTEIPEDKEVLRENMLPWFLSSDRDTKLIHYFKLTNNNTVEHATVPADKTANDLAAIKLNKNYLCDIDYYKSQHYVLFVKRMDSDYSYSRSFIATNESVVVEDTQFVNDDNNPTLTKAPTEDIETTVADCDKYTHFVVFTDLGVADFIARTDDIDYPYNEDLSKWFEKVSNNATIKNANYSRNPNSNNVDVIRDFKYNLVTMKRPGVFTLDSMDNDDPSYQLNIKLKDCFTCIPNNNIIKCFKCYSDSANKSTDDFRRFVNKYFDIM